MTAAWVLRRTRHQLGTQRSLVWASTGAFLILVLVVGSALLAVRAAQGWLGAVGKGVGVLVFLRDETTAEQAEQMATLLRRTPGVEQARMVEPAEALVRLRDSERRSGSAGWMDDLEPGYFPRSLELTLSPSGNVAQRATQIAQRLRSLPGVAQVDAMPEGAARLDAWVRFGQRLGWTVALAALLAAVVVLMAAVGRGRETRKRNAQVLLLLGETKRHARLSSNILLSASGFIGAFVALVTLRLTWPALLMSAERWLGVSLGGPSLLGPVETALCLVLAPLLGWSLGYLATPISDLADA
jgi:cell division protein FtsX